MSWHILITRIPHQGFENDAERGKENIKGARSKGEEEAKDVCKNSIGGIIIIIYAFTLYNQLIVYRAPLQ